MHGHVYVMLVRFCHSAAGGYSLLSLSLSLALASKLPVNEHTSCKEVRVMNTPLHPTFI